MKNILLVFTLASLLILSSGLAHAQDHGLGLGLMAGETNGVSAKLWIGDRSALDAGLGFSLGGDRITNSTVNGKWSRFHMHMDYLYHFFDVIHTKIRVPLYFGAGPRLNVGGNYGASFGIRGVAGVSWMLEKLPIDVFVEAVPVLQFGYDFGFGMEGSVGVRYYF